MNSRLSLALSEFSKGHWAVEPSEPPFHQTKLNLVARVWSRLGRLAPLAFACYLITLSIGVVALGSLTVAGRKKKSSPLLQSVSNRCGKASTNSQPRSPSCGRSSRRSLTGSRHLRRGQPLPAISCRGRPRRRRCVDRQVSHHSPLHYRENPAPLHRHRATAQKPEFTPCVPCSNSNSLLSKSVIRTNARRTPVLLN
jgi:hypothetical protein